MSATAIVIAACLALAVAGAFGMRRRRRTIDAISAFLARPEGSPSGSG